MTGSEELDKSSDCGKAGKTSHCHVEATLPRGYFHKAQCYGYKVADHWQP